MPGRHLGAGCRQRRAAGRFLALLFPESVTAAKLIPIGLILAGVIGLNLSGVTPP